MELHELYTSGDLFFITIAARGKEYEFGIVELEDIQFQDNSIFYLEWHTIFNTTNGFKKVESIEDLPEKAKALANCLDIFKHSFKDAEFNYGAWGICKLDLDFLKSVKGI